MRLGVERHLKDEEALCLDATKFGNVARFINHRCNDANLVEIPKEVETRSSLLSFNEFYLVFYGRYTKMILLRDYGIDFDDETHPIKAFIASVEAFFVA
ncbi:hypothetical protein Patl1_35918 [Pistacia atlantica]|nr:hypothetical protein Patl1_35918 [Pistacia atlantica]